jgi:hypothetical protein
MKKSSRKLSRKSSRNLKKVTVFDLFQSYPYVDKRVFKELPKDCVKIKTEDTNYPSYDPEKCKSVVIAHNDKLFISHTKDNKQFKWWIIQYDTPENFYTYGGWNGKHLYNIDEAIKKLALVKKELAKVNISLFDVGWLNIWQYLNQAEYVAREVMLKKQISDYNYSRDFKKKITSSYIFYMDFGRFWSSLTGKLYLYHFIKNKSDYEKIVKVFTKYFGDRYVYSKDNKYFELNLIKN